jgi:hypothetical protein
MRLALGYPESTHRGEKGKMKGAKHLRRLCKAIVCPLEATYINIYAAKTRGLIKACWSQGLWNEATKSGSGGICVLVPRIECALLMDN